jgi:hypothetical protein
MLGAKTADVEGPRLMALESNDHFVLAKDPAWPCSCGYRTLYEESCPGECACSA